MPTSAMSAAEAHRASLVILSVSTAHVMTVDEMIALPPEILPLVSLGSHRVEGYPQHRSLGLVPPLVKHIGGHQYPVPFRNGIALPLAHQGPRPLQHIDRMFPPMGVPAGVGVADRAGGHGPIVQHDIGGHAIFAAEEHVPHFHVEIPVVAYDGRLACSLAPLVSSAAALRRDERVDLDASDHTAAAIVQGVMVHVPRDEYAVPFPHRVLLPITNHHPGPFKNIHFMLPRMNVMSTGLAGLDHRVRHGTGCGVILQ